jgi:hypothetical protein
MRSLVSLRVATNSFRGGNRDETKGSQGVVKRSMPCWPGGLLPANGFAAIGWSWARPQSCTIFPRRSESSTKNWSCFAVSISKSACWIFTVRTVAHRWNTATSKTAVCAAPITAGCSVFTAKFGDAGRAEGEQLSSEGEPSRLSGARARRIALRLSRAAPPCARRF